MGRKKKDVETVMVSFRVPLDVRDKIAEMQPRNYCKSQVVADAVLAAYVRYKARQKKAMAAEK